MWYVLYTKPKTERKVADRLQKAKIEVYCPVYTEVRQWSDRKKKVTLPLFTSYVFVKLKEKDRYKVFDIPGVIKYLYWLGKPAVVKDAEIEVIQDWLGEKEVDDVQVERLSPGDRVTIKSGVFSNREAIIDRVGVKRVRLILVSLGCTISASTRSILKNVS